MEEEAGKVTQIFASWATEQNTLRVAFATLGVLILAAVFTVWQLLHAENEREIALVYQISSRWDDEAMAEARRAANSYKDGCELKEAMDKLEGCNSPYYYALLRVPAFFEALGVLCDRDHALIKVVRDNLRASVVHYWQLYGPWVIERQRSSPNAYRFFDKLKRQM